MKKLFILLLLLPLKLEAQKSDANELKNISDYMLTKGKCYEDLRVLCKTIGARLSGSAEADKAVQWATKTLQEAGADTVWQQPVDVPVWVRGKEELRIKFPGAKDYEAIKMLSLGNSLGTNNSWLSAPIVIVSDTAQFYALPAEKIKGSIVFFNHKYNQANVNTFHSYGEAGYYRWNAANLASAKGAVGVIIRSVSTGMDDEPHTGSMRYLDSLKKIPAVAIGNESADRIAAAARKGTITAQLRSNCKMMGTKRSYNVIGEIRGLHKRDKIIVVGGHLDSWDVGEGAHDDGAGIVQSIEVLRWLHDSRITPEYTLRVVCFMNEENGLMGGKTYADSAKARNEQHVLAIESDAGGYAPRGFGINTKDAQRRSEIKRLLRQLEFLGLHELDGDEGGADIGPLKNDQIVLSGLMPDPQRYFDIHHTAADVFENVNHRELKLGAAAMACYVYLMNAHLIF